MSKAQSYHSVCRWTFHAGKGGFLPGNVRPNWAADKFNTVDMIRLVKSEIASKVPDYITLGIELHYDSEVSDENAEAVADAMIETGCPLAMITPGLHGHYGFGGPASLDSKEREVAKAFSNRTLDLAYGTLRKAWHANKELYPCFVLWNGSYGYDLATPAIRPMYQNLKHALGELCEYETEKGGLLRIGLEPKPNEGHPAMLVPTVASALVFWHAVAREYAIDTSRVGLNMEFGHSEMVGLDHVHDVIEQLENNAMMHIHLNSQGYNDGIIYGGPGKYDIDHGTRINGMNIAIARLMQDAEYHGWKGHDMQPRPYDNEVQAIDRVVRSILSWEACEHAAKQLDMKSIESFLSSRETAKAEDLMRDAVVEAQQWFNENY